MRLVISFAALFLSVVLLQLGSGGIAPLDAISGLGFGFARSEVGMLGSAHYFGFFIGCWWAPRLMGEVGHSRAFAAFTAMGTIGILAHLMVIDPWAWAGFRMLSGLCVAGSYTVIESWLQATATNTTRGRTMGIYRVVDVGASLAAQLMIGILEPGAYVSYNLLALLCCAALVPLVVTRVPQPVVGTAPRLRPALAWVRSPLAAMAVVVSGLTAAAFRMVGPVYGLEVGLSTDQIALFLAAFVLGGAIAQYPVGWLADRHDRRLVLVWLSVAAICASAITVALAGAGTFAVFAATVLFGFTTIPIYSVATAHAHDFATDDERVELSAALMFLFAVGAIASPWAVSGLIARFGPSAMFVFVSLFHAGLIVVSLLRMNAQAAPARTAYVYAPRTSFLIGRWLSKERAAPTGERNG